jgi:myosin heavy subunit
MTELSLQDDETLSDVDSSIPPPPSDDHQTEQPVQWEDRYKGMQRTFNDLNKKYKTLEQQLQAKDTVATQSAQDVQELNTQLATLSTQYEGQLSQKNAELATLKDQFTTKETEVTNIQNQLERQTQRDSLRKSLTEADPELIGWFESGYLKPFDDDGNPLDGEALSDYLTGFKDQLQNKSKSDFDNTMQGAKPVSVGTSGATVMTGMSLKQMENWLDNPDHYGHSDYDAMLEAYTTKVADQSDNTITHNYL